MGNKLVFWAVMLFMLTLFTLLGIKHGAVQNSWSETILALFRSGSNEDLIYFIWNLRLPKILAALAVGSALAVSGVILQNILNNPLASSFTLGLSQGASFGATFSIIVLGAGFMSGGASGFGGLGIVAAGAFAGAVLSSLIILLFSFVKGMTPQGLILVGVAMSAFFSACTMLMQYFSTDTQLAAAVFWTFGDLGKGGWSEGITVFAVMTAGILFSVKYSWDYNAIQWGDLHAAGLGVEVKKIRIYSLIMTSLMSAFATAYYGVIGFVGLIAPHMVRMMFKHVDHGFLIPASAVLGGVFLLGADTLAQMIFFPLSLPVGVITAFAGVPMFLFILMKRSLKNGQS
ncbi:transport system permease protein [Denitrovibrio acetiphilus DSM 12809]|uniref:Transport system permease protein n=1 Tax=Denitrovibrio acetiphilus (strain DSM 12809 / NBRC 114555 / N2460) TaxID=522772 RepID=D4H6P7_DENA2|nr:iron ABC transporter permease [Denitrovibrio acetiphilus]ADD67763.1 transport system permease protein [Denitrovibrio acetiphilus DSM 12809]